jgi:hypothetical protein
MYQPVAAAEQSHRALREGAIAGVLGAMSVAIWFLIIDTLTSRPLHTPAILGTSLMNALGWENGSAMVAVVIYTLFHFGAFIAVGTVAVVLLHAAAREASVLLAMLILFVAFEVGFYGFLYLIDLSLLGDLAWTQIGAANLLAAFMMGRYLWRAHPELHGRLREGLSGRGSQ